MGDTKREEIIWGKVWKRNKARHTHWSCSPGEVWESIRHKCEKEHKWRLHKWKMHSLEHNAISTPSLIDLFLYSNSFPLCFSPPSGSHHSVVAKSYEADFLSSVSSCVIAKTGIPSHCFRNEAEQRLSVYMMGGKRWRVSVSPTATTVQKLERTLTNIWCSWTHTSY